MGTDGPKEQSTGLQRVCLSDKVRNGELLGFDILHDFTDAIVGLDRSSFEGPALAGPDGTHALLCSARIHDALNSAHIVRTWYRMHLRIAERRAWSAQFTAVFLAVMLLSTGTVLGLSTARRNLDYHSPVQMWTSVVRVRPQNYRGWSSLGVACDLVGDHQHARECFERAIAIHDRDAGSLLGLGLNCLNSGELVRARWAFERGLDVDPKMVDAASNLGVIAARMGDYEAAIKHFDRAILIQPEFCVGYYNRADSLIELGRDADAVEALQAALRIKPDFTQAARKLAWVRATSPNLTLRDGSEAVQLMESKCQPKESQSVHTWDTYGAVLAEAGRYDEAIRAADRAIEIAMASQKTQITDEITLRRNIYRTHQPYRVVRRRVTSSKEQVSP